MTRHDPMRAELERIEAELAQQNRTLEQLEEIARGIGDVTFAVAPSEIEELTESSPPTRAIRRHAEPTGIRC